MKVFISLLALLFVLTDGQRVHRGSAPHPANNLRNAGPRDASSAHHKHRSSEPRDASSAHQKPRKSGKKAAFPGKDHKFQSANQVGDHAVRSPCPAINTLANHGFINRDGLNIDPVFLAGHLEAIYGVQAEFCLFILATAGFFQPGVNINLDQLAALVKPVSLFLKNDGLSKDLDEDKFAALEALAGEDSDVITLENLKAHHVNLIKADQCDGTFDAGFYFEKILTESLDTLNALAFGNSEDFPNLQVNLKDVKFFVQQNKFPPGWEPRDLTANPEWLMGNIVQLLISPEKFATFPPELQGLYSTIDTSTEFSNIYAAEVAVAAQVLGTAASTPPECS